MAGSCFHFNESVLKAADDVRKEKIKFAVFSTKDFRGFDVDYPLPLGHNNDPFKYRFPEFRLSNEYQPLENAISSSSLQSLGNLKNIPKEILITVISFCNVESLLSLYKCCKGWNSILHNEDIYKQFLKRSELKENIESRIEQDEEKKFIGNKETVTSYRELYWKNLYYLDAVMYHPEKLFNNSRTWNDFIRLLPFGDCKFGLIRIDYNGKPKTVFLLWAHYKSKIKSKMVFTSVKDELKKKISGITLEMQATDFDELNYSDLEEKLNYYTSQHVYTSAVPSSIKGLPKQSLSQTPF